MSGADATAFAVISPDGGITWYPLGAEQEVEALVAGKYAARSTVRSSSPVSRCG